MCDNVTALIGELGESNAEIWDSSVFYGFWYVVSEFVSADLINEARNETLFASSSNDVKLQRLIRPSRPKGVFSSSSATHNKMEQEQQGMPIFQALVDDREAKFEQEKLVSSSIVVPQKLAISNVDATASKIIIDKAPKVEKLSSENVTAPQHLIGDAPKVEKFVSQPESDFLVAPPQKAISPSTLKIVGEKINTTAEVVSAASTNVVDSVKPISQLLLLSSEQPKNLTNTTSTIAAATTLKLSSENVTVIVPPQHLIGNSESESAEKLVGDAQPKVDKPIAKPKVAHLAASQQPETAPLVAADKPVVGTVVKPIEIIKKVDDKKIVRPQAVVADEEIFPRKLVSAFQPEKLVVVDKHKPVISKV
jgi:hypothetical protein